MPTAADNRTKRRQQREETRLQILAAAEQFLREHPYRELNVDALMADTGLTRTVFYRHFDDLADVVLKVMEGVSEQIVEFASSWRGAVEAGVPLAEEGLGGIVDLFIREGRLIQAIAEAAHHDEEIERAYRGFLDVYAGIAAEALEQLRASGRALEPLEVGELATALTLMNERYLLERFGREPLADRDTAVRALMTIWQRAVFGRDLGNAPG